MNPQDQQDSNPWHFPANSTASRLLDLLVDSDDILEWMYIILGERNVTEGDQSIYDPVRPLRSEESRFVGQPPRRFYGSFWRSLTRRLLIRVSNQMIILNQ